MLEIKKLDPILDEDILYKIVEMEDLLFGEASIGNYNIKPMAKYGKVYVILNGIDKLHIFMEFVQIHLIKTKEWQINYFFMY